MKKIAFIFGLLIFISGGCSEFLDVNENPNYPTDVEDYLVLPAAQASLASVMSADYGLIGGFWSQHWAQNNTSSQYKTFETYTLSSSSNNVDGSYRELYIGALSDNEIIHLKALEEENWNLYLMTSVIKAYTFQYLVDLYGNVPYDEAFLGVAGEFSPKVNTGEEVYKKIYDLLNTALSMDYDHGVDANYETYDLYFEGDVDLWVEFANTLKLRLLVRQYEANTEWAKAELMALLADPDVSFLSADASLTNFEDADSKSNPLFEADQRQLNTKNNIRANATLTYYLKENNDPRLEAMFTEVGGDILGMISGTYELPSTVWNAPDIISQPKLTADMPVYLMTVAEANLLLAEAQLVLGEDAEAAYDAGVAASFDRMEVEGYEDLYPYPVEGSMDEKLEAIIMQKWIDAADGQRGCESFIEMVRTGYPALASAAVQLATPEGNEDDLPAGYVAGTLIYSKKGATGGKLPKRLPYPDSELNYNSSASAFKAMADLDVMLSNVWWNEK